VAIASRRALGWYHNAAFALAVASNGSYGAGYGWASPGDPNALATATSWAGKYANETCQKFGGNDCQVKFNDHTPNVTSGSGGSYTNPFIPPPPPQGPKQVADWITNLLAPLGGGPPPATFQQGAAFFVCAGYEFAVYTNPGVAALLKDPCSKLLDPYITQRVYCA
jgi:hypothetical protein